MRLRSCFSKPAAAILVGLLAGCRCGGDAPGAPASSAAPSVSPAGQVSSGAPLIPPPGASAAASDAGGAPDAGPDFAAGECPDFDPDRWQPYKGFDDEHACWFFTPAAADKLPAPIAWEPCAREEFGNACRRMKHAQGQLLSFDGIGDPRQADAPAKGPVRIAMVRGCKRTNTSIWVVAPADGPITGALAHDPSADFMNECSMEPRILSNGWGATVEAVKRGVMDMGMHIIEIERTEAALLGLRGQLVPQKLDALPEEPPLGEPAELSRYRGRRGDDFVAALAIPGGADRSAVRIASDGVHIVWSYPEGEQDDDPKCALLASRWSEDPSQIAPVRAATLRCKDIGEWKVGCGHAATRTVEGQALLVRLSDGTAFRFPKLCAPLDGHKSCPTKPLAISCKDIYLAVGGPGPNIFRVPLDGLPPGTPPAEPPAAISGAADARPADAGAPH